MGGKKLKLKGFIKIFSLNQDGKDERIDQDLDYFMERKSLLR